jgi:hypothetical protein
MENLKKMGFRLILLIPRIEAVYGYNRACVLKLYESAI